VLINELMTKTIETGTLVEMSSFGWANSEFSIGACFEPSCSFNALNIRCMAAVEA
jgi:hypothetical protein